MLELHPLNSLQSVWGGSGAHWVVLSVFAQHSAPIQTTIIRSYAIRLVGLSVHKLTNSRRSSLAAVFVTKNGTTMVHQPLPVSAVTGKNGDERLTLVLHVTQFGAKKNSI